MCAEVVGEQCFNQLVLRYMRLGQIKRYSLDNIGVQFSHLLSQMASIHYTTPYLPALCELEYSISKSLQAPDLLTLEMNYAVHSIWQWHQQGLTDNLIETEKGRFFLIITRNQFNPELNLVSEPLFQVLQLLKAKLPLKVIATHATYNQQLVEQCVANGWVDTFYVNE